MHEAKFNVKSEMEIAPTNGQRKWCVSIRGITAELYANRNKIPFLNLRNKQRREKASTEIFEVIKSVNRRNFVPYVVIFSTVKNKSG